MSTPTKGRINLDKVKHMEGQINLLFDEHDLSIAALETAIRNHDFIACQRYADHMKQRMKSIQVVVKTTAATVRMQMACLTQREHALTSQISYLERDIAQLKKKAATKDMDPDDDLFLSQVLLGSATCTTSTATTSTVTTSAASSLTATTSIATTSAASSAATTSIATTSTATTSAASFSATSIVEEEKGSERQIKRKKED